VRTDNGPEFTSRAFMGWAHSHGIRHILIEPGRPMQNGYIESFNGKFRDECLNEHWFETLPQARAASPPGGRTTTRSGRTAAAGACRRPSSPLCIGSMLPMQLATHHEMNPLTLQPDFLPNDWYGYRGQVSLSCQEYV
jgi:hypothetical protein